MGQQLVVIFLHAVQRIQQLPHGGNGLGGAVGGGRQILHDRGRLGQIPLHQKHDIIDGIHVGIHEVTQLPRHAMGAVAGIVGVAGDTGDTAGHSVRGGLCVIQRAVDHIVQAVQFILQLIQAARRELQRDIRGHLPHDAAHILAALYGTAVDAAGHVAILTSGNAAHIIAHMRIAHRAGVDAALQDAVGVSGNAAGIGGHGILRYILTFQQVIEGAFDVFKIRRHVILADGGVDRRRIGAVQQRAGILAGDTTGELTAPYHTGRAAVEDLAAGLVLSGDAAYIVTAHDDT